MVNENTSSEKEAKPGLIRKEMYAHLESQGFELSKERHKHLSHLVKLMANTKNEEIMRKLADESTMRYQYEIKLGIRTPAGHLLINKKMNHKQLGTKFALLMIKKGKVISVLSFRTIRLLKIRGVCFRKRTLMMAEGII